ncbi:hypothetical protein CC80DRAFT_43133 [Byssothecium circinans]|uniref:Uncharacterized protein n=1 Tax=Byssothecium circinans TaxID=147558 RepID=A0A6A5U087_9PLEO|nr:hypothetical protein CC80DRAFT_43133 [Byssothecium circinans]
MNPLPHYHIPLSPTSPHCTIPNVPNPRSVPDIPSHPDPSHFDLVSPMRAKSANPTSRLVAAANGEPDAHLPRGP